MKKKRYKRTLWLVDRFAFPYIWIYDMGLKNELGDLIGGNYFVMNNFLFPYNYLDFDEDQRQISALSGNSDMTTSFEVFEHLLNPYTVLKAIRSERLLCTVPLKVWFSRAYWGKDDFDQHYHEFEVRQFLKLLDKTGWEVKEYGKWRIGGFGIRPFLRYFFPSYLWVYAERR